MIHCLAVSPVWWYWWIRWLIFPRCWRRRDRIVKIAPGVFSAELNTKEFQWPAVRRGERSSGSLALTRGQSSPARAGHYEAGTAGQISLIDFSLSLSLSLFFRCDCCSSSHRPVLFSLNIPRPDLAMIKGLPAWSALSSELNLASHIKTRDIFEESRKRKFGFGLGWLIRIINL